MIFTPNTLTGSFVVEPVHLSDSRGWFARTYCKNEFEQKIGQQKPWVQMNQSFTARKGTVRGMHFQKPPFSEVKLIRCVTGAVYDVIVDLRKDSATYLQWFGTELSAINKKMMYIPEGFAHGFQSLTDNAELIYHHSQFYTPESEGGILFNDVTVGIQWPLPLTDISERDRVHPVIDSNFKAF